MMHILSFWCSQWSGCCYAALPLLVKVFLPLCIFIFVLNLCWPMHAADAYSGSISPGSFSGNAGGPPPSLQMLVFKFWLHWVLLQHLKYKNASDSSWHGCCRYFARPSHLPLLEISNPTSYFLECPLFSFRTQNFSSWPDQWTWPPEVFWQGCVTCCHQRSAYLWSTHFFFWNALFILTWSMDTAAAGIFARLHHLPLLRSAMSPHIFWSMHFFLSECLFIPMQLMDAAATGIFARPHHLLLLEISNATSVVLECHFFGMSFLSQCNQWT